MAYVDTLIRSGCGPRTGSAWQFAHRQHERPEFAVLIAHIERAARDVLAFLKVADAPFHITGCWVNVLDPGGTHAMQSHPNNYLSGFCRDKGVSASGFGMKRTAYMTSE
ncbi:hypothetical protein [Paraburkholderia mimosarum]|uniref:hypothetical protein n=1 Tax=Paraburkholderia mimosarum TaxID=312026 RepID=UPI0009DF6B5D|nr:hypothetical protein [Paraburkholderia mimosarum]